MRAVIPKAEADAMKFSDLAKNFVMYKVSRGGSQRTSESYMLAYQQFLGFLQGQGLNDDIRQFTADNVEKFTTYMVGRGLKGSSAGMKLAALSSLGVHAMRTRALDHNPADKRVERPKRVKPAEKYLYRDEIQRLLAVECHPTERLALMLLADTQLRASELTEARVENLSMDGDKLKLDITVKGGRPETVDISPRVAEPLLESLRQRRAEGKAPLIVNTAGNAYSRSALSEMVAKLARRAGITRIPVRAHVFARHSPASILGQEGASVFEIAALLRHSDLSTAQKYVHGVDATAVRDRVRGIIHA